MTHEHTQRGPFKSPIFLAILFIWFAISVILSMQKTFETAENTLPILMPTALIIPLVVFLLALTLSGKVRAWADRVDVTTATSIQSWRVMGAIFVFLWAMGQMPVVFALFAGIGDFAVGVLAAFATVTVGRQQAGWQKSAKRVIYFGMLDFTIAIITGLSVAVGYLKAYPDEVSGHLLAEYPMVLFPVFIVPCFMIMHILVWRKL